MLMPLTYNPNFGTLSQGNQPPCLCQRSMKIFAGVAVRARELGLDIFRVITYLKARITLLKYIQGGNVR